MPDWRPIDPGWTFEEAVSAASSQHRPGTHLGGPARNAVVRGWIAAVGGARALKEIRDYIATFPSLSAAARRLSMSRDTLVALRSFAASLPSELRPLPGLSLFFAYTLAPFDRFVVEAAIFAVLGKETACRVVEVREMNGVTLMRLDGIETGQLEHIAEALWSRSVAARQRGAEQASPEAAVESAIQQKLDAILARLDKVELRLPNDAVREMLSDSAEEHILKKDRALVRTWDQKAVASVLEAPKGKLLVETAKQFLGLSKLLGDE